ncbi:MAG: non-heme iron oxygenase ferredoxin subunit [Chloroflexota bacterium]|nr:non-heme iron oxygenase ferredoxin subunit [Dehalococcoidia bacterium]MDW8254630.1 non-heme iron oxygenase ferredoxin subunit [Chloroflexota bacterium]
MSEFRPVAKLSQLPDNSVIRVELDGEAIAVARSNGEVFACQDACTHEEASLSDGDVFDGVIECPLHGARFDLRTGAVKSLPAVTPIAVFEVKIEGDDILVKR